MRKHATNPASAILFVGYQAEHTLGRKTLDGKNSIRIYGEDVEILADVERGDSYSAHAGRNELLDWADGVRQQGSVENWFLVHGESDAQEALAEGLAACGAKGVVIPERLERIDS